MSDIQGLTLKERLEHENERLRAALADTKKHLWNTLDSWHRTEQERDEARAAIKQAGLHIAKCSTCEQPVVWARTGWTVCKPCATKQIEAMRTRLEDTE